MIAKFCDRCGKQLTEENFKGWNKNGKYDIELHSSTNPIKEGRNHIQYEHMGRWLMFCKDCQVIIDRVIENECKAYLPKKLVAETEIVKKEDEE